LVTEKVTISLNVFVLEGKNREKCGYPVEKRKQRKKNGKIIVTKM